MCRRVYSKMMFEKRVNVEILGSGAYGESANTK